MAPTRDRLYQAYTILSGDDQLDRACARIPDSLCTNLPRNYVMNIVNGAASKMAEQVASAKVTLPWLLSAIGAPAGLIGLLLPLRQTGTLLPQLAVSGQIRRFAVRKWFWVASALVQVVMLLLMIGVALTLPPKMAGLLVVAFLVVFSLARGVGSLSFQDVTGKTIPKGRRGRMLAARSMIGGLLTIAVGLGVKVLGKDDKVAVAIVLLACGALLWSAAALAFAAIRETPGATEGGRSAIKEARAGLTYLRGKPWYRNYLTARAILLSVEVATPFYVLYVKALLPQQTGALGAIVVAAGLAGAISSPLWGKFADLSSRKVLVLSGALAAATGALTFGLGLLPPAFQTPTTCGAIIVLLGFAEAGVLLGRKTFLIDQVPPAERATYVAFGNTAMGMVTLLYIGLGWVVQVGGVRWVIGILSLLALAGAAASLLLPETTPADMEKP